jgi:site-specific recombinase
MNFFKKKKKQDFIDVVTRRSAVLPIHDKKQGLEFLVSFFSDLRPSSAKGKRNPTQNMLAVIREMHQHPVLLSNLQHALVSQMINTDLTTALTESGIPLARGFWQEFFGRLRHKILPPLQRENDYLYVVNHVFFRKNDYRWVEDISPETWISFFEMVGLSFHANDKRVLQQLLRSLKTLSFQVAQLGLEKEVVQYLGSGFEEQNPFVDQNYLIHELEELLNHGSEEEAFAVVAARIEKVLDHCFQCIDEIRKNHSREGTSLHQTYILFLLANKLDRMGILVDVLDRDKHFDTGKFVIFFRMLVRNENRKNSILEFMSQCMGYLAYQIAEHKGSKGNKYITSSRKEYNQMLLSSMKGGGIICFVVIIKNVLTNIEMPIFWHGFTYSMNYSAGFVLIEETHSTLATKQPAFTASAVASTLDTKKNTYQPNLYNLAITVAKVSRSQIASFLGNLLIVFPGTYLLAWLYHLAMGTKIVEGEAAAALLKSQHPWQSLSLLYACNTGVFLFLSGIIAGYVQNKIQHSHITERLNTHPFLTVTLSKDRLGRFAGYIEKHAGSIVGNVALGFMLGMAGLVVKIFGIPFDIRHITISAGNASIAVYGLGFGNIRPLYLITVILGILGIGFINFLVSFSLAFIVAVKSRGVHLRDYPEFLGILWRYFRKKPLDFIRPRKQLTGTE